MDLHLDNLDRIYQLLKKSQQSADNSMAQFNSIENIPPTPEKRQLLDNLLDSTGSYLIEISHIDSFLQSCDLVELNRLNPEQHNLLIQCQALCQSLKASSRKVIEWSVNMKKEFNEASCPVYSDEDKIENNSQTSAPQVDKHDKFNNANEKHISSEMIQAYLQARDILKKIHSDLIYLDPEDMTNTAGRRLKVMEGKKLFLETEHEMNVFMDYCIFQYHKNGKNIVQRYYDKHASLYSGKRLELLTAFKNTRFSLLKIVHSVDDYGLIVDDPLIGEKLLMLDKGACQVAKSNQDYAILTHYLCLPDFIMTTGASTPILLTTDVGKEMQTVFDKLILHHQGRTSLDEISYKQAITDLYKIAIHRDALKIVTSRELPFNFHQLYKEDIFVN